MVTVKPARTKARPAATERGTIMGQVGQIALLLGLLVLIAIPGRAYAASSELAPLYKPSGRSPQPMDIRLPAYGGSQSAPAALTIGDKGPDFELPQAGGGTLSLESLRRTGPVVIIFYRGHW